MLLGAGVVGALAVIAYAIVGLALEGLSERLFGSTRPGTIATNALAFLLLINYVPMFEDPMWVAALLGVILCVSVLLAVGRALGVGN